MKYVYAIPNRYPYNELLLSGKLSAKTRVWKWNHTGMTLLYTSQRFDRDIVEAHGLPGKFQSGVLVGYGMLQPVRLNSFDERADIEAEFCNCKPEFSTVYAAPYRYEFTDLTRFKKPIPFTPAHGSIRVMRVPVEVVQGKIPAKLLKQAVRIG